MPGSAVTATPQREAGAVRMESVILIAELRNFTRLSEMLEAERALSLANRFFDVAAQAAQAHGGIAIAAHNDSLLTAFCGGPASLLADKAVRTAQRLFGEFDALAQDWERDLGLRTAIAMGVHRGETVFGACGPASDRRQAAFGDCVSIAERLVHRARAGELVLSDAVMGVLSVAELELDAEPLPPLDLHHRPAMRIYGVLRDERLDFTST